MTIRIAIESDRIIIDNGDTVTQVPILPLPIPERLADYYTALELLNALTIKLERTANA